MAARVSEDDLIDRVKPTLQPDYKVFEEVGLFNRSIDMVLLNDSDLVTVEFKIRDWRQAVRQIKGHLIAADFAYLCMPNRRVSDQLLELLTTYGIGLWLYDFGMNTLIERVKPRRSTSQWTYYRSSLISKLLEREGLKGYTRYEQ
jgi:hypothetical protein